MLSFVFRAVALVFVPAKGDFLAVKDHSVSTAALEQSLLFELAGAGDMAKNKQMRADLEDLYISLPKNERGLLEPAVVRYALHRYFAKKYGWHLQGIGKEGGASNDTAVAKSAKVANDRVPEYMMKFFESRAHGQGVGLEDLAVFVAALSDVIARETSEDAERAWELLGDPDHADSEMVQRLIRMNLVARMHGVYEGGMSLRDYLVAQKKTSMRNKLWPAMKMWGSDLFSTYRYSKRHVANPFDTEHFDAEDTSYDDYIEFMHVMTHKYGTIQNLECKAEKRMLMDMEYEGTGRVSLSKFYSGAGSENWPFTEKVDYLRNLGALDESVPGSPSVIIPNYLTSLSNCLFPSDFYSVCCLDECEDLMGKVERAIADPAGQPARIADLISKLPSETVEAPRNLSTGLMMRLSDIAERHGGVVPLHSRLFAQWLHHAYPRECPFPHVSGTVTPLAPHDWIGSVGGSPDLSGIHADEVEVQRYANLEGKGEHSVSDLPWNPEEELVGVDRRPIRSEKRLWESSSLRYLFLVAGLVSILAPVVRSSKLAVSTASEAKAEAAHFV